MEECYRGDKLIRRRVVAAAAAAAFRPSDDHSDAGIEVQSHFHCRRWVSISVIMTRVAFLHCPAN